MSARRGLDRTVITAGRNAIVGRELSVLLIKAMGKLWRAPSHKRDHDIRAIPETRLREGEGTRGRGAALVTASLGQDTAAFVRALETTGRKY